MPRPGREQIMTTLLAVLVDTVQTSFTADTQANSPVLNNPSTASGLFVGVPVTGPGIQRGSFVKVLSPLTLSEPAIANGSGVQFKTGFLTFGRRLKFWPDVSDQPALYLRDPDEDLQWPNIILLQQTIKAEVWILSNAGADPDFAPIIALNNLLDAVQSAFIPDDPMQQRFTLGGLVHWCRMSGKVEKWPGDIDGQAVARAEVEIIVP